MLLPLDADFGFVSRSFVLSTIVIFIFSEDSVAQSTIVAEGTIVTVVGMY